MRKDYLLKLIEIMEFKINDLKCPGGDSEKIKIANELQSDICILKKAIEFENK